MVSKTKDVELIDRASKALVTDSLGSFYATPTRGSQRNALDLLPNYNLNAVIKLVRNDSVAWGAITTLVDRSLEQGWMVVSKDSGIRRKDVERYIKNKGIDMWLREMLTNYFVFNNAFGELVYTEPGTLKEIHVLDPSTITIESTEHGEVAGYRQEAPGKTVSWKPEEIIHIADANFGLNTWGEVVANRMYQAVAIKYHIKRFIGWLFETNQFRGIYNPKSADDISTKRFITFLKESEKNIEKPVIVEGEFEYIITRDIKDLETLNKLLYKMDEEILNLLQVPPIYAGLPDNSNRSNSDAQERAFNTRIKSIHMLFNDHVTELLKRSRYDNVEFKFRNVSLKVQKELLEMAQLMKSMTVKNETITKFLKANGFDVEDSELFDPLPQPLAGGQVDEKFFPSRKRKGEGDANKQIGTGERGTTREDQLVSRARAFDSYPYIYDTE